jgi:hypothetical protein
LDKTSIFSKTGKGVLRLKHKSDTLPEVLVGVLRLIDGKSTLADLVARVKLGGPELYTAMKILADEGYIREVVIVATPFTVGSREILTFEDELDFTRPREACSSPSKSNE